MGEDDIQTGEIRVLEGYLTWKGVHSDDAHNALRWVCQTLHPETLSVMKARYSRLAQNQSDGNLRYFPEDKRLLEKVLVPIHQAKAAFVLGHELACIALCGMVGEMLATLRFEMCCPRSPLRLGESRNQELMFGKPFEHLDHRRRIDCLQVLGWMDKEPADLLRDVASVRNRYLHGLNHSHEQMAVDAIRLYGATCKVAEWVLGLRVQSGGKETRIRNELLELMGLIGQPSDSPSAPRCDHHA